jgi:uncharacterized protein involved in response to NO
MMRLLAAPHRVWFFAGLVALLLTSGYWAVHLLAPQFSPELNLAPGWVHAWFMLYGFVPFLIFGFLMTTYPAWLDQPALRQRAYLGPAAGMSVGWLAAAAGLLWSKTLALTGFALFAGAWGWALWVLLNVMIKAEKPVIHARLTMIGLVIGLGGTLFAIPLIENQDWRFFYAGTRIATWGFLVPVFVAVCHRMLPFFTRCIDKNHTLYRPEWTLWLQLAACLLHLWLELRHLYQWLFLVDLPLLALSLVHAVKWWPRQRSRNALLLTLHIGHGWLVLSLLLYSIQSLVFWQSGEFVMGRAPVHALGMGFAGSMLVAMVTRVSQGHSGRPLEMPAIAQLAFLGIQLACILRIANEFSGLYLNPAAVLVWLLCLLPWVGRYAQIYWQQRVDGKDG